MGGQTSSAGGAGDAGGAGNGGQQRYPRLRGGFGPGTHGRVDPVSRAGHMEYDRILFFTDAVFAIAITLLIVDLPVSVEHAANAHVINSHKQLVDDLPGIVGFGISFAVIALFWLAHHSMFRYIKAIDRPLMLLNLLFLGVIAFLPYPTELLSATSTGQAWAVSFYAACAGGAGLFETLAWLYAMRAGLVEGLDRPSQQLFLLRAVRVPLVFGVSIAIAQASPGLAADFWIVIVLLGWAINRYYDRRLRGDPPAEPVEG